MKVHVVEDELSLLRAAELALTNAGHEVTTSQNGHSAAKEILETKPDAIVMDMLLPGTHGMDIIKQVRQRGYKGGIVVFTNSDPNNLSPSDIKNLKINEILIKSNIRLPELIEAVEQSNKTK